MNFFRVGNLCGSLRSWLLWYVFPWRTATIRSHKSSAGFPSNLNPASEEMISDSVELCETEVCFKHIQLIGTNVWLPQKHNVPPDVGFESSRSPAKSESALFGSVSPHGNTVCTHMNDESKRSNEMIVCHKLWSILWSIVQVCSVTMEYQVFQYVPRKSISERFESILLTILQRISILLLWNDGHQCMEWILCRVVESSCLPTHNIVPHISWHALPCHKTTKNYADFPRMVIFQLLRRKFWIQTWFCNCQQYLRLFHIVFEYTQVHMI